ncbi:MAG: HAMP domain-containing histidine kinase [Ruminococcaceae bacterium]|nr:HAMP domain-containing histidine kinase [Oscillospiraceae bacterium]
MKSKSIRYYYFTTISTLLVACLLILGLVQTWQASGYFREEKEAPLRQVVASVVEGYEAGQIRLDDTSLRTVYYMARIVNAVVFIARPDGQIVFSTGPGAPPVGQMLDAEILQTLTTTGEYNNHGRMNNLFFTQHFTWAAPLQDPTHQTAGYIFASADASDMQSYLSDTFSTYILSAAIVLLVASIWALVFSNRIVAPVRRMSEAARRFGEGDYSARVPVHGDDELAQLAITFNEMANSFEATDFSRRSFMGNIAHELRTPMTTIKGFIDGMLDGTIPEDQRDKYLAIVSDEVGRLARLTRNMLDISRLEAGEYTSSNTRFDIWGPLASVLLNAEQRLLEKQLTVEGLDAPKAVYVMADEDFVHQILFNLVDNAIKFADDDGTITVTVQQGKAVVTVGIRNTGEGIPEDALNHVFDRFYKEDSSRGVNARGAGLGLHISKVLLGLMNGRIWAESEAGQWAAFLFTLPAAPQKRPNRRGDSPTGKIGGTHELG